MTRFTPKSGSATRSPIRWSSDSSTVECVLRYCQREYHQAKKNRYGEARRAILARVYGNLLNANHLAYNGARPYGEISYETVARELTKSCDDSEAGRLKKQGYLAALDSEWDTLSGYFERNFVKPEVD